MADLHHPRFKKNKLIPLKYSWEEADERRSKGLCIFCEEEETSLHYLKHKNLRLVIVENDDDQLYDGVLDEKKISGMESLTQLIESSIQEVGEKNVTVTNAVQEEENDQKKTLLLEISQDAKTNSVAEPMKMEEISGSPSKDETQEAKKLSMITSSIPQSEVSFSFWEPSLRSNNSFRLVLEVLSCAVKRSNLFLTRIDCSIGKVNARQMFDAMAMREHKIQQMGKWNSPPKTWKFKFKDSLEKDYEGGLSSSNSARVKEPTFSMADIVGKETRLPYIRELLRHAQFHTETGSSGRKIMRDKVKLFGYNATISDPHMHATYLQLLEDKLQQGIRALQLGLGIGYLTGCFVLKGGAEGCVGGVDHIFGLIDMSIKNVEKSVVASLLKKGSLSLHVGDGRKDSKEFAASLEVPYALLDQLKNSGPRVILVRTYFHELNVIDKSENGSINVHTETSMSNLINQAFDDGLSGLILVEVIMHYKRWSIHKWHEWKIMLKKKRKHSKDWWFKYKHMKRIFSSRP